MSGGRERSTLRSRDFTHFSLSENILLAAPLNCGTDAVGCDGAFLPRLMVYVVSK
jgi:hypothetical protein